MVCGVGQADGIIPGTVAYTILWIYAFFDLLVQVSEGSRGNLCFGELGTIGLEGGLDVGVDEKLVGDHFHGLLDAVEFLLSESFIGMDEEVFDVRAEVARWLAVSGSSGCGRGKDEGGAHQSQQAHKINPHY
jgi:hypothetical protein